MFLGFRISGSGIYVLALRDSGFRAQGLGFRISGLGLREKERVYRVYGI